MKPKEPLKILKRTGTIVEFDKGKITEAIFKAFVACGGGTKKLAENLSDKVMQSIKSDYKSKMPTVEQVQDIVEKVLIEDDQAKVAKAYILYRQKRREIRDAKKTLYGIDDDIKLSINAIKVLEKRYLRKDKNRNIVETPGKMFDRVALNIAQADLLYDKDADISKTKKEFYEMMTTLDFMPNSPTLMNAGAPLQQLSACFVLPVEDTMEGIFDAIKNAALVHKSGGGTGFSFSRIRHKGDVVNTTSGMASGPVSFMKVFNAATEVIKQGGTRRGANMGILRVDHPDILEFVIAKEKSDTLNNFNLSVGITEKFMKAVEKDEEYDLLNPANGEVINRLNAKRVFNLIVTLAWKNGEPGIIFIDRMNRDNPTPAIGEIESTNPCGEQPLLPYEACNLGSINLIKMVKKEKGKTVIDWNKLKNTVRSAVHFLDNVIDMSKFPLERIAQMVKANRKIGLGVMGFSDMLIELEIPYNSQKAVKTAGEIQTFITKESKQMSQELALARGNFPNYDKSIFAKKKIPMRNATTNTIAPTGTISIIAGCSSGIEPLFAISFIRNVMDGTELLEANPLFEKIAKEKKFYSEELMRLIARTGTVAHISEIPEAVRKVFVTAHEVAPLWHIKIQAAFQKNIDNAVSKTVNFSNDATTADVEEVYMLAYKLGCKGVTIYRDGSREEQVLNIAKVNKPKTTERTKDGLKVSAEFAGGCETCGV